MIKVDKDEIGLKHNISLFVDQHITPTRLGLAKVVAFLA